jgi:hypothetical protein
MNWQDLAPGDSWTVLAWFRAVAARLRRDDGEIGIIGAVIIAAGLAAAAVVLVVAINGKLHSWIGRIP